MSPAPDLRPTSSHRLVVAIGLAVVLLVALGWFATRTIDSTPLVRREPAPATVRLLAVGDTGRGGPEQARVAAAMARRAADVGAQALLLLGDLNYQGCFGGPGDPAWERLVFGPYGQGALSALPIFPLVGNREERCGLGPLLEQPRWHMPGPFYTVEWGDLLQLVATDSTKPERCGDPARCCLDWVDAELGRGTFAWRIVAGHHNLESSAWLGELAYTGGPFEAAMRPLLCERADLYLAAHAHVLEYRELSRCGLPLAIAGAGGDMLYEVRPDPATRFAAARYGFAELEVSREALVVRFWSHAGERLHETRLAPGDGRIRQ